MSSLVIDLVLCGIAYVVLIYFVATITRIQVDKGKKNEDDDGDGGIEDLTPPKIDSVSYTHLTLPTIYSV